LTKPDLKKLIYDSK